MVPEVFSRRWLSWSMVLRVVLTCWRPASALCSASREESEVRLALRATSSTAADISVTAVAAISISSFCRVMPWDESSVTACSSSAAEASWVAALWMPCRVSRRLSCICLKEACTAVISSLPLHCTGSRRSPAALRATTSRSSDRRRLMPRLIDQACRPPPISSSASSPATRLKLRWYRATPAWYWRSDSCSCTSISLANCSDSGSMEGYSSLAVKLARACWSPAASRVPSRLSGSSAFCISGSIWAIRRFSSSIRLVAR